MGICVQGGRGPASLMVRGLLWMATGWIVENTELDWHCPEASLRLLISECPPLTPTPMNSY